MNLLGLMFSPTEPRWDDEGIWNLVPYKPRRWCSTAQPHDLLLEAPDWMDGSTLPRLDYCLHPRRCSAGCPWTSFSFKAPCMDGVISQERRGRVVYPFSQFDFCCLVSHKTTNILGGLYISGLFGRASFRFLIIRKTLLRLFIIRHKGAIRGCNIAVWSIIIVLPDCQRGIKTASLWATAFNWLWKRSK